MSNTENGRAAYTGAKNRAHTTRRNYRKPLARHFIITRVDERTLSAIDAVADKWRITRGEAIDRITRLAGKEVAA